MMEAQVRAEEHSCEGNRHRPEVIGTWEVTLSVRQALVF